MTEKRGAWYLLTGVILGLVVGLILSAWILPVQYVNADPSTLRDQDKQIYRGMIAQAYLVEGDVYRAQARLRLLGDPDLAQALVAQAQNMLAKGKNESQARALALLAAAINQPGLAVTPIPPKTPVALLITPPTAVASGTVPVVTRTPGPTSTPRPTLTPMATAGAPFVEEGQPQNICDPLPAKPQLQVTVLNAAGAPVAGVKIEISQANGGTETFYTGLFPEISRGYADYEMLPGVSYTIRVGETGQPLTGISAPSCTGGAYGSLKLVFKQP
jgi:hypothetical protein